MIADQRLWTGPNWTYKPIEAEEQKKQTDGRDFLEKTEMKYLQIPLKKSTV